jgi:membrane protein YqaA with SNARE-associated domain
MFKEKLKNWFIKNAQKPAAKKWLNVISFTESSFFPIPPDPFQIALTLFRPKEWFSIALNVLIWSVLGGIFGYIIGFWFFDILAGPIIEFYGFEQQIEKIGEIFNQASFWATFIAAFSPIPYKVFTVSAGLFQINFFMFVLASIIGRGARFFIIGYISSRIGEKFSQQLLRYFNLITMLIAGIIILYLAFKLV